jgi:hypothetical protein
LRTWQWVLTFTLDGALLLTGIPLATKFGGAPLWACTAAAELLAANAKVRRMHVLPPCPTWNPAKC